MKPLESSIQPMDLDQLIGQSHTIFVGKVVEIQAKWNAKHTLVMTDVSFEIEEIIKSKELQSGKITYTFAGGSLDGISHQLSTVPVFLLNERMLVMIDQGDSPQFSPITGSSQGKFSELDFATTGAKQKADDGHASGMHFGKFVDVVKNNVAYRQKSRFKFNNELPVNFSYEELGAMMHHWGCVCSKDKAVSRGAAKSFARLQSTPVTVNPRPGNDATMSGKDVKMMNEWNRYANIFRVADSSGEWEWLDGKFDVAGFVSERKMQETFGSGWGGTLGVTFTRTNSRNEIVEADVFLNPNAKWASSNKSIPFTPYAYGVELTLIHELGHVLGLDHDFTEVSVMNYAPQKFDGDFMLRANDIKGLQAVYPEAMRGVHDAGIYFYKSGGYKSYTVSQVMLNGQEASEIKTGGEIKVMDYTVENAGVSTVSEMRINWFLSKEYADENGATPAGSSVLSVLGAGSAKQLTSSFQVPDGLAAGKYYVMASLDVPGDSVSTNNTTWMQKTITVSEGGESTAQKNSDSAQTALDSTPSASGGGGGGGCLLQ